LPVTARLPVWPQIGAGTGQAADYDPAGLGLFTAPFTLFTEGGVREGTAEDALAALARLQTLAVFQATDEDGAYLALPRALVGTEVEDAAELAPSGDTYPVTVPARALTVAGEWGGGVGEPVPRKGVKRLRPTAVRLTISADVNLVRDNAFVYESAGIYAFWAAT